MTRDELDGEIAACAVEFRTARDHVDATELRMARAFALAADDDQLWYVGRVMEMLGALVRETEARNRPAQAAALMRAVEGARVH